MKKLFEFFAQRHMLANLFTLMVLLLGLGTVLTLQRDIFPAVDFGMMQIITTYPGASPEDVELNVTNKIEDELKNVTGLDQVTSISMENLSQINAVIEPDVRDQEKVKRDIRDAVARVTDLPAEVSDAPMVVEIDSGLFEILEIGIAGDIPYRELRDIAHAFEKKLLDVPGVSRVQKRGYRAREIKIEVDPQLLDRYQIPMREIIQAVQARNIRATAGTFESFVSEKNVVTLAQFRDPTEVGDVIVRSSFDGPVIRLKDLALIKDDFEDQTTLAGIDGKEAITMTVYKSRRADIIRTVDAVKELIRKESGKGLVSGEAIVSRQTEDGPGFLATAWSKLRGKESEEELRVLRYGPVEILFSNDVSRYVKNRFGITLTNGLIGLVLVLVVLSLFLSFRTAFWVAMGIPVAVMGVFFLLPVFDSFLDSITLTCLVLMIGIIVDDGIIVSENIARRHELGDTPIQAAVNGTHEVFFPVLTTILTTFLAFAPMFWMPGMMGKFVFVIPLTVTLALFISLLESSVALPAHIARGLAKRQSRKGAQRAAVRRWFDVLRKFYRKLLRRLLVVRYPLAVLFVAALAGALWFAANHMEFILFPTKSADRFIMQIELDTGSSLEATAEKVHTLEGLLDDLPEGELATYISRIGSGLQASGEHLAYIMIGLTPYAQRSRDVDQIIDELREKVERVEGVGTPIFMVDTGGPSAGKAITLRVAGNDNASRKELVDHLVDRLGTLEGVKDIDRDDKPGKEQIEIKIDHLQLARLGLTVADVAQNVRTAFDGEVVTSIRQGDEDVPFRIQLSEQVRRQIWYLRNLSIPNREGRLIKLDQVARLVTGPGPSSFRHFDSERTTTIEADVDQDVITSLEATSRVLADLNIEKDWPGLTVKTGGEAQESQESMTSLFITFGIALIGVYFLLVLLFNSFTQPILVIIAVPFGIVGVIITFALHGQHLSFLGLLGIIGLAGVVVNDSLVLVDHVNRLRREKPDIDFRDLVAEGTSNRLRAIILTSVTTVAGLLPLAYGIGGTDLYMQPMALAMGYGILFATPLTLVLVPCLFVIGNDIRRIFTRGGKPVAVTGGHADE